MAPNFQSLLNKPMNEIKRDPILPEGTYFGTIMKHEFGESSKKKTPFVSYSGQMTHAAEDVELNDEEGNPFSVEGRKFQTEMYLSDAALPQLKDFLSGLGIEVEGKSLGEVIPQAIGASVQIAIAHEMIEDKQSGETRPLARVRRLSAVQA